MWLLNLVRRASKTGSLISCHHSNPFMNAKAYSQLHTRLARRSNEFEQGVGSRGYDKIRSCWAF
ncbi:hypothetical protein M758_N017600 [Ceratodon purpureus]|nr:hypothetical protein M758_N017600 [Ceratodon purpureus]